MRAALQRTTVTTTTTVVTESTALQLTMGGYPARNLDRAAVAQAAIAAETNPVRLKWLKRQDHSRVRAERWQDRNLRPEARKVGPSRPTTSRAPGERGITGMPEETSSRSRARVVASVLVYA